MTLFDESNRLNTVQDQLDGGRIARLIIAGNSLTLPVKGEDDKKIVSVINVMLRTYADVQYQKRFNSTSKPLFPNHPTKTLATLFADLLSTSLPIHLIPGPSDPAGTTLPQQPLPKILFGGKAKTEGLECGTNPTWMEIGGRR